MVIALASHSIVASPPVVWQDDGVAWTVPVYSREAVNRAGRTLVRPSRFEEDEEEKKEALVIVDPTFRRSERLI
jgi:hypothetical protein